MGSRSNVALAFFAFHGASATLRVFGLKVRSQCKLVRNKNIMNLLIIVKMISSLFIFYTNFHSQNFFTQQLAAIAAEILFAFRKKIAAESAWMILTESNA